MKRDIWFEGIQNTPTRIFDSIKYNIPFTETF